MLPSDLPVGKAKIMFQREHYPTSKKKKNPEHKKSNLQQWIQFININLIVTMILNGNVLDLIILLFGHVVYIKLF